MYLKLQIEVTASFYTHDIVRLFVLESSFVAMEFIHFQPLLCVRSLRVTTHLRSNIF